MKQGYYTLTADVKNPTPDRRSEAFRKRHGL
jgi:hypothetical protein